MNTKEQYLQFVKDLKKTAEWVSENIEAENATIIITWLLKCSKKLESNLNQLIDLKNNNE